MPTPKAASAAQRSTAQRGRTLASLMVQTSLASDQKRTEMTTEPHSSEAQ